MSSKQEVKQGIEEKVSQLLIPALLISVAFFSIPNFVKVDQPASTKPFNNFEEFYPFYLSQHVDLTCRRCHFVGTTLCIVLALMDPLVAPCLILAGMLGYSLFYLTRGVEHGFIELVITFATFSFLVSKVTGKWHRGIAILTVGYGFAWIGHFIFEKNRPATFIYPVFSLLGDFRLWSEIASGQRAF
jgi:hypothetical protein